MKPTLASFVGTFLKPEMWHVYNQVSGLQRFKSLVLTRERRNEAIFPHGGVHIMESDALSWWQRGYMKYVQREPQVVYRGVIPSLVRQLDGLGTDLLHIYFGHEATRLAPLFDRWKKPAVVSFHGADLGTYVTRSEDMKWLPSVFGHCRLIMARCESFVPFLVELGCPKEKIRINRTHIRTDFFDRTDRTAPADGAWNLMQACRLIPKKGLMSAVRAFAVFQKSFPRSTFTIAGDGPQLGELQKEVWRLGLTRSVFFVGFVDRPTLRTLYRQSHFFLHPSETDNSNDIEGIPNALLEAMGTGLVCVSTPHAGIPEAITHGVDGLLVPEKNPDAIAAELVTLCSDPVRYQSVSAAATHRIATEFSPEKQISILEDIYEEALRS